ncbi:AAA domain-containing protein [Winogradskyella undariae]|uniref:AAA domain-containing protein n=1 Tax=Winogradskyella undariae TaxID=1285465 RepID=UPI0015CC46C6|nr:AAA domain-containing protein [Winogradskyella undariae]
MAYKSYLLDKFEFTHENRFFRILNEKLKNSFEDGTEDHILIGNINVGGHSLDAIFLKRGAITVIDFKDYSGELTFSLNGPWRLNTNNKKTIFVAGGAHSRNPFQQVNAYRFALFQLLGDKSAEILDSNHQDVSWAHTNGMVLFQRAVKFDVKSIPAKVQRYFHISHFENITKDLKDLHAKKLNLSNKELQNVLKVLNVAESSLYNKEELKDEVEMSSIDPGRMDRVIKLIPSIENENEIKRALGYYNSMISIERINQASVRSIHNHPINWSTVDTAKHIVRLEENTVFLNTWLQNTSNRFPENLFVSINLLFDDRIVPLFYTVIANADIDSTNIIKLNFDSFDIYAPLLEELNLTEDIIEDLKTVVNQHQNIHDKIEAARTYLDVSLELQASISLGLSKESLFTAQLQSELNQWINNKKVFLPNPIVKSILTNTALPAVENLKKESVYQITSLNNSQKKGIELSFNQPLTIITGPPGTGKSQVVTNILANAIIKGEKILFSSKNNKAVDNVHQRISNLLNTDYFLRLGTTTHNNELIQKLTSTIQGINNEKFQDKSKALALKKSEFKELSDEKNTLEKQLKSIKDLELSINTQTQDVIGKKQSYKDWISSLNSEEHQLYIVKDLKYNVTQGKLNQLHRIISDSNGSASSKLIFKWFKKKKLINSLNEINSKLAEGLQVYIDNNAPMYSQGGDLIKGFVTHINFIGNQRKLQDELTRKNSLLTQEISNIEKEINKQQIRLDHIVANQQRSLQRIHEISLLETPYGLEILGLTINEKLRTANIGTIESYKNYLQSGMPWRNDEQKECSNITNAFLEIFNTISITSLNIKKGFLQEPDIFDLLVIDEASQCDITSAIPLIYRAKRVVIIGDSLQLPHITSVKKHEQQFVLEKLKLDPSKYNYINQSLFEKGKTVSNLSLLDTAFLDEHYRCHPEIIGYSNQYFYLPKAGHELDVKTKASDFKLGNPGIHWEDVKGTINPVKNENMAEVAKCIELAKKLVKEFPDASIGIATPFKHQKEALKKALSDLPKKLDVLCDVIHKFQGDEKDIMILSLVVTKDCKPTLPRFINQFSPYLLNVAVSRAKSALYIVGNKNYCINNKNQLQQKTLLSNLAIYEMQVNAYKKKELDLPNTPVAEKLDVTEEKDIPTLIKQAIDNNQTIAISYKKYDGTLSSRNLSDIAYNNTFEADGFYNQHIKGLCNLRNESRTFKIDRITGIEIIK